MRGGWLRARLGAAATAAIVASYLVAPLSAAPPPGAPVPPTPPAASALVPDAGPESPDADPAALCRESADCQEQGLCSVGEHGCLAASDADCAGATACRAAGRCAARGDACVVASDADCARSEGCRDAGACAARGGLCVALSDDVCRRSAGCAQTGQCRAEGGRCTAPPPPPTPPKAAPRARPPVAPAASLPSLALELQPLVGVGFTDEQAEVGFFGEALAGLRWRSYASVALGLGGGNLGADHHVVLVSAVPAFRPLPAAHPIDIAIGLPLGYVNYSHKAFALVGDHAELTSESDNGFHVGGLLSVMVPGSDAWALGPVLQFNRVIAARGASFFAVAIAGRYSLWLDGAGSR